MGTLVETYRGGVRPHELDHMDHLNVASYVAKFDEGSWSLFAQAGLTPDFVRENNRGMAGVEQNIRYLREVRGGDLLRVRSGFLEVKEKGALVYHEMLDQVTGEIAATMEPEHYPANWNQLAGQCSCCPAFRFGSSPGCRLFRRVSRTCQGISC